MYFYLYKITNKVNEKFYIGVHQTENLNDGYMGSGKILQKAIKKYGQQHFYKEILCFFESEEEMYKAEKEIVNEDFIKRWDTYNINLGGSGGWNYINSSRKNVYGLNGHLGCGKENLLHGIELKEHLIKNGTYTQWCNKISLSLKQKCIRDGHWWVGKTHKEETKKKIGEKNSINQQGSKNSHFGRVWIYNLSLKKSISIAKEELETYIINGWEKGRICKFDLLETKNKKQKNKEKIKQDSKEKSFQKKRLIYEDYLLTKSLRQTASKFSISHVMVSKIKKEFELNAN